MTVLSRGAVRILLVRGSMESVYRSLFLSCFDVVLLVSIALAVFSFTPE